MYNPSFLFFILGFPWPLSSRGIGCAATTTAPEPEPPEPCDGSVARWSKRKTDAWSALTGDRWWFGRGKPWVKPQEYWWFYDGFYGTEP